MYEPVLKGMPWGEDTAKKNLRPTSTIMVLIIYGPRREKTCLWGFANNTGADQPAHPCSLISNFVIHFLESTICKLATGELSIFKLVSVAEKTGLKLAL